MAKRTNITRIIESEIEKGNVYVIANGNFVSAEMLEKEIKDEFKKEIAKDDFDVTMSFETFKQNKLNGMRTASDLLAYIKRFFEPTERTEHAVEVEPKEVTAKC